MAYTDDVVKAKLSALNETQESIVTVAQWVMFHRLSLCLESSERCVLTKSQGDMQIGLRASGHNDYKSRTQPNV